MEDGTLQLVVDMCLKYSSVWTRNAKAPSTAVHPLTQVRIATGSNPPIRQKACPIPHKCVEAVRAEVSGLLKAGLIEPGYSNWCSPVLCVVKKDTEKGATGKDIHLKIAVDFHKRNAATELDTGSLGNQGDILETFHNRPYNSLCDAAGEYYQCEIHPSDKHKICFVLPMSCGGTTFVWRIAPYGLTNTHAIYSRARCNTFVEDYRIITWGTY
eukprot:6214455-Pleurochrysis_carterae.AAC.1